MKKGYIMALTVLTTIMVMSTVTAIPTVKADNEQECLKPECYYDLKDIIKYRILLAKLKLHGVNSKLYSTTFIEECYNAFENTEVMQTLNELGNDLCNDIKEACSRYNYNWAYIEFAIKQLLNTTFVLLTDHILNRIESLDINNLEESLLALMNPFIFKDEFKLLMTKSSESLLAILYNSNMDYDYLEIEFPILEELCIAFMNSVSKIWTVPLYIVLGSYGIKISSGIKSVFFAPMIKNLAFLKSMRIVIDQEQSVKNELERLYNVGYYEFIHEGTDYILDFIFNRRSTRYNNKLIDVLNNVLPFMKVPFGFAYKESRPMINNKGCDNYVSPFKYCCVWAYDCEDGDYIMHNPKIHRDALRCIILKKDDYDTEFVLGWCSTFCYSEFDTIDFMKNFLMGQEGSSCTFKIYIQDQYSACSEITTLYSSVYKERQLEEIKTVENVNLIKQIINELLEGLGGVS